MQQSVSKDATWAGEARKWCMSCVRAGESVCLFGFCNVLQYKGHRSIPSNTHCGSPCSPQQCQTEHPAGWAGQEGSQRVRRQVNAPSSRYRHGQHKVYAVHVCDVLTLYKSATFWLL